MLCVFLIPHASLAQDFPTLSDNDFEWLGEQIYRNECNQNPSCLIAWNQGEDFPSLGIGHFIWYRANQTEIFEETFPLLLERLKQSGVQLPDWVIHGNAESPWLSREQFLLEMDSPEALELRDLLDSTKDIQSEFIVHRFHEQLQNLVNSKEGIEQDSLRTLIEELSFSSPPYSIYALIDYSHFKGTGLNNNESYQGQGWGLLQVLEEMMQNEQSSLLAFVASARKILENRVANAPASRNEGRWLQGWLNRLDTYLPSKLKADTLSEIQNH